MDNLLVVAYLDNAVAVTTLKFNIPLVRKKADIQLKDRTLASACFNRCLYIFASLLLVLRAPVLVALALIECGMEYEDAVHFIRL